MSPTLRQLALGRSTVDRAADKRSDSDWWRATLASTTTRVVCLRDNSIALNGDQIAFVAVRDITHVGTDSSSFAFLGLEGDIAYVGFLGEIADDHPLAADLEWHTLRASGASLSDRDAGLATTAFALRNWHRTHTHCPRCGATTVITQAGWVRQCPHDGSEHYPRTDPAVIVCITDPDDRILLARQTVWQPGHFSIVAGFVEPGETFEAATVREAAEEVGLRVSDVEYLGSQPWPFPASLMIGVRARAASSDIQVDGAEIEEARWFSRADLVAACAAGEVLLPARVSIARRIIENWYGETLPTEWSRP